MIVVLMITHGHLPIVLPLLTSLISLPFLIFISNPNPYNPDPSNLISVPFVLISVPSILISVPFVLISVPSVLISVSSILISFLFLIIPVPFLFLFLFLIFTVPFPILSCLIIVSLFVIWICTPDAPLVGPLIFQ